MFGKISFVPAYSGRIVGELEVPPKVGNRQPEQLDVAPRIVPPDIRVDPKTVDHDVEAVLDPSLVSKDRLRQPN